MSTAPATSTYVRNFTDVDDKINATALARKEAGAAGTLEELIAERTEETIAWYHADMDALGNLRPTQEPRATAYIAQMVAMIEDADRRVATPMPSRGPCAVPGRAPTRAMARSRAGRSTT